MILQCILQPQYNDQINCKRNHQFMVSRLHAFLCILQINSNVTMKSCDRTDIVLLLCVLELKYNATINSHGDAIACYYSSILQLKYNVTIIN